MLRRLGFIGPPGAEDGLTTVEQRVDAWANRRLVDAPSGGPRAVLAAFVVFALKQGWACCSSG